MANEVKIFCIDDFTFDDPVRFSKELDALKKNTIFDLKKNFYKDLETRLSLLKYENTPFPISETTMICCSIVGVLLTVFVSTFIYSIYNSVYGYGPYNQCVSTFALILSVGALIGFIVSLTASSNNFNMYDPKYVYDICLLILRQKKTETSEN